MIDYKEVIHNVIRLCKANKGHCYKCDLGMLACPNNLRFDVTDEKEFEKFAMAVMDWAAKHPEPVYPTWAEWLKDLGLIVEREGEVKRYRPDEIEICFEKFDALGCKANERIPTDMAERLGISPKFTS